jgi:hypothetical protein
MKEDEVSLTGRDCKFIPSSNNQDTWDEREQICGLREHVGTNITVIISKVCNHLADLRHGS